MLIAIVLSLTVILIALARGPKTPSSRRCGIILFITILQIAIFVVYMYIVEQPAVH